MHDEKRPPPTSPFGIESTATVEHVAPQDWEKHWREELGFGDTEEDRWRLGQIVHRIGNLTLVTHALNNQLGNNSWSDKANLLDEDNLEMTRRLLADMGGSVWNEREINQRSRQLAEYVIRIWPHAEVLARDLGLEISSPKRE